MTTFGAVCGTGDEANASADLAVCSTLDRRRLSHVAVALKHSFVQVKRRFTSGRPRPCSDGRLRLVSFWSARYLSSLHSPTSDPCRRRDVYVEPPEPHALQGVEWTLGEGPY